MTGLIVSIASLVVCVGALAFIKRNWLTFAETERTLAETDRSLAASFTRTRPDVAAECLESAERHEQLAVRYTRRAWPWRPKEPTP